MLDGAEALSARHGIDRVTSRQILEAAGQRNASAISYYFGSREGLLSQILARRGGPVDAARGRHRAGLGPSPSMRELVVCLVEPYASLIDDAGGRSYLRIVAQLRGRFAAWRVESDAATTAHLAGILDEIESGSPGPAPLQRERVVGMIMLLTGMAAERARRIDEQVVVETSAPEFTSDLIAMCTAVVALTSDS